MISKYKEESLHYGIPGFGLQVIGSVIYFIVRYQGNGFELGFVFWLPATIGTVLLFIGLAYYSKAKGYPAVYCFLGLWSLLGIIILSMLKDRTMQVEKTKVKKNISFKEAISGVLIGVGGVFLIMLLLVLFSHRR